MNSSAPNAAPMQRATRWIGGALLVAIAAAGWIATHRPPPHYLPPDTTAFVASFAPPPADASPRARAELDELLALQRKRSAADVESARADRRKDVDRFYQALGLDAASAPDLPALRALTDAVEKDVGRYVNAAKAHFARARPYVREPALEPCITGVEDDNSYPSGHATYGYVMAYLLAEMVPERRAPLLQRAAAFAHARALCGVHYPSDLAAGQQAGAWLAQRILQDPGYRAAAAVASRELRMALQLPPVPAPN